MLCFPMLISFLPGANHSLLEHKIGIFVRFWGLEALFSGFSSTKSRFLCAFALRNPHFWAFRAQNRGFCARLLNLMSGLGHIPAERGIVAPALPSYLRSRCAICRRL